MSEARLPWFTFVLGAGQRYWPGAEAAVAPLPVPAEPPGRLDNAFTTVPLPPWAADLMPGKHAGLLVDTARLVDGEGPSWTRCQWWNAVFDLLTGMHERRVEARRGPLHSYALRLSGLEGRLFDRAWVNRIFLFLRRWAAREAGADEARLFGPLPAGRVHLTHDVDAVRKTPVIRAKQSVFHTLNAGRAMVANHPVRAAARLSRAFRFSLGPGDFWRIPELCRMEAEHNVRSSFHFYAGATGGRPVPWQRRLFDPSYDLAHNDLSGALRALHQDGWAVGLHPGHAAWADAGRLGEERRRLEAVSEMPVTTVRQHWLRFSWEHTWAAQAAAGLRTDFTLGFNDRPGFRAGAALAWTPWMEDGTQAPVVVPTLFMDSHFYDYHPMTAEERRTAMGRWLDEVAAVRGEAAVLWHQRVLAPDYGWGEGYADLLRALAARGLETVPRPR